MQLALLLHDDVISLDYVEKGNRQISSVDRVKYDRIKGDLIFGAQNIAKFAISF